MISAPAGAPRPGQCTGAARCYRQPVPTAVIQEQEGYATVGDGRIAAMSLVCSGFRPAA